MARGVTPRDARFESATAALQVTIEARPSQAATPAMAPLWSSADQSGTFQCQREPHRKIAPADFAPAALAAAAARPLARASSATARAVLTPAALLSCSSVPGLVPGCVRQGSLHAINR